MALSPELEAIVGDMLAARAITLDRKMVLKDGRESQIYINMRDVISEPILFTEVVRALGDVTVNHFFQRDAKGRTPRNRTLMSVPGEVSPLFTGAVIFDCGIPALVRRQNLKKYGHQKLIEGSFEPGAEVVLLDDVISSAESKITEAKALAELGLKAIGAVVLVDRQQGGRTALARHNIELAAALDIESVVDFAYARDHINEYQRQELLNELDPAERLGA